VAIFFWFNRLVFKATQPSHEDISDKNALREKRQ
jgi:hypothetical protein